jgi:hypothetical protein
LDTLRAGIADPDMAALYDYWLARRGDRRMPSRRDIDPVDLPRQLPNLMLIDVEQPGPHLRYRLIGTRVVEASAENRTGEYFDNVAFFAKNPVVMQQYLRVVETGMPVLSLEPFKNFVSGSDYQAERLLLPLSSDGQTVDMLLVHFGFKSGPWGRK